MTPRQRIGLAIESLDGRCCVSRLADAHDVSRKFVYRQQAKAQDALESAFAPPPASDPEVLFHLPVTDAWLRQFALVCVLVAHSSLRGVTETFDCLLGLPVSLGWVHSVVKDAIDRARPINDAQGLSRVGACALDEIFQNGKPVLAVVDVHSTYCCLLTQEERRDADTWGVRLLELQDQGLAPRSAIADGGNGLRAGLRAALPELDGCDADVWHPLRDFGEAARFLENRACAAIETHDRSRHRLGAQAEQTRAARGEQDEAIALADDVAVLLRWLRTDVLAVAGPHQERRHELLGFVLKELQGLRGRCEHRLGPLCSMLASQGEDLLRFCERLDAEIADVAAYAKVSEQAVRRMIVAQEMADGDGRKWRLDAQLRERLGGRYHGLSVLVQELRRGVVRASSVVENVNSRLRNYFFLRKEVGGGYLDLLRFFLNHRRFLRSEHPERVGKSPAELLNGEGHAHWLELLGYERFCQAQAA